MNLTDAQKQKVVEWVQQGLKLSDIQNRLASELSVTMTYMEVKLVLAELELRPKDQEPPKGMQNLGVPQPTANANAAPGLQGGPTSPPGPGAEAPQDAAAAGGGNVVVTVDAVTRPGSVVSGKVTFSDQKTAEWYLDQQGRLGFAPAEKGYRPSELDLVTFQTELQSQLARYGF